MKKQAVKVKLDEENPESIELIAKSIIQVSEAFEKINSSPLKRRAIVLLLQDAIGVGRIGKSEIELILDHAPKLKNYYLKELNK